MNTDKHGFNSQQPNYNYHHEEREGLQMEHNSQIEDDHFISVIKIMFSGIWVPAFAGMTGHYDTKLTTKNAKDYKWSITANKVRV